MNKNHPMFHSTVRLVDYDSIKQVEGNTESDKIVENGETKKFDTLNEFNESIESKQIASAPSNQLSVESEVDAHLKINNQPLLTTKFA